MDSRKPSGESPLDSFPTSPGRRKLAGDMLCEALNPPQPVPIRQRAARIASVRRIRSNLTGALYESPEQDGNH